MKKIALPAMMLALTGTCLHSQLTLPLYDSIPNSKPAGDTESQIFNGILRIMNVSVPTITLYKPSVPSKQRPAIIICPGGGYGILAAGHEGSDVAKALTDWGITAIVLKYRLPDDSIMNDKSIGPLQDAQRAIQLARQNAQQWNIDPARIGIMGFSAGGHLASTASTHFDRPVIENRSGISLRPDFSILIYPVISFSDSIGHKGSRDNLIGKNAGPDQVKYYSNEKQVNSATPPAFLVHAKDDEVVKVGNSINYYNALQKNRVRSELHLYEEGGHGFGMHNKKSADSWMTWLKQWLESNDFL